MPTYLYPPLPANTKRTLGIPLHDKAAGAQATGAVYASEFQGTGWVLHLEVSDPDDFPGSPPRLLSKMKVDLSLDTTSTAWSTLKKEGLALAANYGLHELWGPRAPAAHHLGALTTPQAEKRLLTDSFVDEICLQLLSSDTFAEEFGEGGPMHRRCTQLLLDGKVPETRARAFGLVLAELSENYQDGVEDLLPMFLVEPPQASFRRPSPQLSRTLSLHCEEAIRDRHEVPKGFTWRHLLLIVRNTTSQALAAH